MDVGDRLGNLGVSRRVVLDVGADAFAMESMLAGVDEELAIVKDGAEADVAVLRGVDHDVPVLLMTSLRPQKLSVLRMLFYLRSQLFDLLLVVIKTIAQVLLHIAHFGLLGEQVEQVFNFEHVILPDNRQGLLHLDLLLAGGRA